MQRVQEKKWFKNVSSGSKSEDEELKKIKQESKHTVKLTRIAYCLDGKKTITKKKEKPTSST